jgi:hypothetical protein
MWGIQPHAFTVQPRAYLRSRRNRIDRAVPEFVTFQGGPGIDSQPGGPVRQPYLMYRSARQAETTPAGLLKRLQIRAL